MIPGIDVSHFQGVIDWKRVKAAGIQFAYVKATQGASFTDPKAVANCMGACEAGIPFGLYHVFLARTGKAQIDNWLGARAKLKPDLPSWLDIEPGAVTEESEPEVIALLEAGFTPRDMIYCSPGTADYSLTDHEVFSRYGLAVAHYNVPSPRIPKQWTNWVFWQHVSNGRVDGVPNQVDLDWYNEDQGPLSRLIVTT